MDPFFSPGPGSRPARRRSLGRLLRPLGAALAMGLLLPVLPAQAARPVTIHATIGSCWVTGESRVSGPLTLKLWTGGTTLRSRMTVRVDDIHGWEGCLPQARVRGGDLIEVTRSGKLLGSLTVPAIAAAVDRVTDEVTGTGPAGRRLMVRVVAGSNVRASRIIEVPSNGQWSHDFSAAHDIKGSDLVDVEWTTWNHDTVERRIRVPHLDVVIGRAAFEGAGAAGAAVEIQLWSSKGALRGTASPVTLPDGSFDASFRKDGSVVSVKDGDVVVSPIASDAVVTATMVLVPLPAPADRLMATCPVHARYRLVLTSPGGQTDEFWNGQADLKGRIVIPGILASHHDWNARMTCWTKAGDSVTRSLTLP